MPSFNIIKDASLDFKNKSIAIIAATQDKEMLTITEAITKELSKQTTFSVLNKKEILSLYPEYPLKVKGPYIFAFKNIREDYKVTDLDRIKKIQDNLKTDYVIFLWCPSKLIDETASYYIIMQGFSKSNTNYFAYGKYWIRHSGKERALGAPDNFEEMVKKFSKNFAKVIGEKTGTLKK